MSTTSIAGRTANAVAISNTSTVDYYLDGETLIIASATMPGRLYVTTATDCSCPAGLQEWPCPHADVRLNLLRPTPNASGVLTLDQIDGF
jgi:hypothetical protein